jgi:hypothetical protein
MKNLFEQFANSGEVTGSSLSVDYSINLNGSIVINRGSLNYVCSFWVSLSKTVYNGYFCIYDLDIQERFDHAFGGMQIDNIAKLKESLKNSGLSKVAEGLDVSYEDECKAVYVALQENPQVKELLKGALLWEALDKKEQTIVQLEHAINNYEKVTLNTPGMRDFNVTEESVDEDGNKVEVKKVAPLATLKEKLQELKSK